MPNPTQPYKTVVANIDQDKANILALWHRGLTHEGMPEAKFDWYYRHNPAGPPQVFFLCHGESVEVEKIGVAAVGMRKMRFNTSQRTQEIFCGALVDFVTVPEHRTLFPSLFLQKEIRRLALGADLANGETHEILYGLPNPNSLAIVKRVGYQLVGYMVRRVRMLRSAGYLSRHAPTWISHLAGPIVDVLRLAPLLVRGFAHRQYQSHWLDAPDARFDDLWQRSGQHNVLMGVRDAAFLTWRFVDCPLRRYRFFTLTTSDNKLIAYAVCAVDGETMQVHDFLVDSAEPAAARALWLALSRHAFALGHSNISVEFLGSEWIQRELETAGMMKRQQRPLYATTNSRTTIMQEANWYLTCADEDG